MDDVYISEGKCVYCDKTFSQVAMAQHLKSHLTASEKANRSPQTAFHLAIDAGQMFLHILAKGETKFTVLDDFLRDIWVNCCDHLSGFSDNKIEIKMSDKLKDKLAPKMKIRYDYDFGTTTTFYIKVAGIYQLAMKEPWLLLSRNEPLKMLCHLCKIKPALVLCSIHMYTNEYLFCASCAKKHEKVCEDFDDYSNMPVVNSPRLGRCGYTGGDIDWERDGAYGM